MRLLDWIVLIGSLVGVVGYGLYRSRGPKSVHGYLLAGKTMPWYAMALSIMATQASAITFISTTAQGYADGMRFVQFYLGLPLAMIILSATAVPIFHRANVYTAYEYLERRFDVKTRTLVGLVFLIQRGLGVGLALYAPAIVLGVLLGWSEQLTITIMGILVLIYTVLGGVKAVTWTEFQQMLIIFAGIIIALLTVIFLLPREINFLDALYIAGAAGKLQAIDFSTDVRDRYTVWSGLLGGMFLALAYFGTDQSQVQRYLTGKSIAESKISLLFNAVVKLPMQFFILFTGAMVFVFFVFEKPPIVFHPGELERLFREANPDTVQQLERNYEEAFQQRQQAAYAVVASRQSPGQNSFQQALQEFREADRRLQQVRQQALAEIGRLEGGRPFHDVNYIFLSFVTRYMPAGVVGLVLAMIFAAAMSSIAAEINALATVTVIDVYRRHFRPQASDRHYLQVSRLATLFWGIYAIWFAQQGGRLGTLIEAVNIVGSLFYGSMLGVFVLAFFFPRVTANAAFLGVIVGEALILLTHFYTHVSYLWFNLIGCIGVIVTGLALSYTRWFQQPARG